MSYRWMFMSGVAAFAIAGAMFWAGRTLPPLTTNAASVDGPGATVDSAAVSAEEYRAVFDQYVSCAAEVGMVPEAPVTEDRFGRLGVVLKSTGDVTTEEASSIHAQIEACRSELNKIELARSLSHRPSNDESIAARNHAAACLSAAGLPIRLEPSREELQDLVAGIVRERAAGDDDSAEFAALAGCMQATADAFNWPAYGGS